ncbi:MAG: ATP-binding protein [Bdellovibrio sp.]
MQNFWEKSNWQNADKHLLALQNNPFQRPFPALPEGPGLFVIRGPRQIGKSSWLKTLLLLSVPEESFYVSCEGFSDHKDLTEFLKTIPERNNLFLDEISFVDQWWRSIKSLLDQRDDIRIVVTGSHAYDLKKGMDQMPGRWGGGGEFELLPMDFMEFSAMRRQANWPSLSREEELELYFKIGGFPMSLAESGPKGKKPVKSFEIYRRWLLGDLMKMGKQEAYLREIISQLALTMGSTVSLQKIAQRTQVGSHNTAQDYIELLETCFALKTLYEYDLETSVPKFRKEKKFYFRDPLIYWIALEWGEVVPPKNTFDVLAEMVAHEHLVRRFKKFGFTTGKKGEIDFISPKNWAIEVKWKDTPTGLSQAYRDLVIQDKVVWTKQNFLKNFPGK